MTRAGRSIGLAACALLVGSQGLGTAIAEVDTRTISFHHMHTGENLTVTYKRDGRYDDEALKKINHVMRDWRRDEEVRMDPRVIDTIWEVNREVGGKDAIQIVCGYRAPATNQMLRRRSRGVAQFSQHTLGKAVDFYIPGVPLDQVRAAGLRVQNGGVGFYPTSGSPFVHLDVGSVRHWPRMTHDQLARVFPNGRTVHVPSDGKPLAGYALALADVQRRGGTPSQTSLDAARNVGVSVASGEKPTRGLFTALFGSKDEEEDSETAAAPAPSAPAQATAPRIRTATVSAVPMPAARPRQVETKQAEAKVAMESSFALASAESKPVLLDPPEAPAPKEPAPAAAPATTDFFTARGLWEGAQGRPEPPASIPEPKSTETAAVPSLAPARAEQPRPSNADMTGAVAQWPTKGTPGADRVPADVALAYAAQADSTVATPVTRVTPPMGAAAARSANATTTPEDGITTILKRYGPPLRPPARPAMAPTPAPPEATPPSSPMPVVAPPKPSVAAGSTYEDPWLRAVVLAPDLQNYLTVTAFEPPDQTHLRTLILKPPSVVMMTFSNDPHLGMTTNRFTGSAVVFVSTVTFAHRTAQLR